MIDIKKKKYETRDGREVELAWDDLEGNQKIGGRAKSPEGWVLESWTADGCYLDHGFKSQSDLIEVKEKKPKLLAWKNIGNHDGFEVHFTEGECSYYVGSSSWERAPHHDRDPNE